MLSSITTRRPPIDRSPATSSFKSSSVGSDVVSRPSSSSEAIRENLVVYQRTSSFFVTVVTDTELPSFLAWWPFHVDPRSRTVRWLGGAAWLGFAALPAGDAGGLRYFLFLSSLISFLRTVSAY